MTTASAGRQASDPSRTFPVRRISFEEAVDGLTADFATDDDVLMCHLLAALSGLFPDGEALFIESVRHYRDEIADPDLKRQVNAFIGQEITHGREHRRLNERLAELGYRSKVVEETLHRDEVITPGMRRILKVVNRKIGSGSISLSSARRSPMSRNGPKRVSNAADLCSHSSTNRSCRSDRVSSVSAIVAMTAALEHYTHDTAEIEAAWRAWLDDDDPTPVTATV